MIVLIKKLYFRKDLLAALVLKNIKVRYKQSLIGPLWLFLQPIILTGIFLMIQVFMGIKTDIPYPVFVFSALIPWSFFSNAVIFSSGSIVDNAPIIKKLYCPREVFPVASVLTGIFDFISAFIVFAFIMLYYGIAITPYVLLLPLLIVLQMVFAIGIALLSSAVAVYKRDIIIGIPIVMQFWLFASPVMYPFSAVPEKWKVFYLMNPMAGFVESYRSVLVYSKIPDMSLVMSALIGTILVMVAGMFVFNKLEKRFADVV
jgi:lipopolysaccharide transport system permease protein